ncbi:MAG: 50S ribosomal protein L23 [Patescibacteria group bacterium]|nr:50S ribosomal protein L23 [Patescibacteria group bacterium]
MGLLDRFKKNIKKEAKKAGDKTVKVDSGKDVESKKSMKELYEDRPSSSSASVATSAKEAKAKEGKKAVEGKKMEKRIKKYGNAYWILVKPLVTEKATNLGAENKYVFAVSPRANKIEIAKAINEVYGIKPVAVNIIKMQGKKTRYGKVTGRTKDWKKAVITLPEGKSIKVYEGV